MAMTKSKRVRAGQEDIYGKITGIRQLGRRRNGFPMESNGRRDGRDKDGLIELVVKLKLLGIVHGE